MAIFTRRETPPQYLNHRDYAPHLRKDFVFQCAYCERTEEYLGGQEAFEVDHFRPDNRFPELRTTYINLYWVCGKCNRHKSGTWPSDEQVSRSARFADPCDEDPVIEHLQETADGGLVTLTPCGVYSNNHIRLSRAELRTFRLSRRQAKADLPLLRDLGEKLQAELVIRPTTTENAATEAALAAIGRRIEEIRARFLLD